MPSEVTKIVLPYQESNSIFLDQLDIFMREKRNIYDILSISNNIILRDGYGLTKKEIELADRIWRKLSFRRLNRRGNK